MEDEGTSFQGYGEALGRLTYRFFPQLSAIATSTPPPTLSSHPSPTPTSDNASIPLNRIDTSFEPSLYVHKRELFPNVISGNGRFNLFSALVN